MIKSALVIFVIGIRSIFPFVNGDKNIFDFVLLIFNERHNELFWVRDEVLNVLFFVEMLIRLSVVIGALSLKEDFPDEIVLCFIWALTGCNGGIINDIYIIYNCCKDTI